MVTIMIFTRRAKLSSTRPNKMIIDDLKATPIVIMPKQLYVEMAIAGFLPFIPQIVINKGEKK